MKFAADRLFADPEAAARKLVALANAFEPVQVWRMSNVSRASLSEPLCTLHKPRSPRHPETPQYGDLQWLFWSCFRSSPSAT
jgi:hypothetical protein